MVVVVRTGGFLGIRGWSSQVAFTLKDRLNLGEEPLHFSAVKCKTVKKYNGMTNISIKSTVDACQLEKRKKKHLIID